MRKESPLQKKEKKNLLIRSKKQSDWEWRGMNCDSGSILWLFSMQRSIRKTGFHETWWSRGFTSILSKGRWGEGERVSTLLYFQQLVFLDDCVTFRSSRISIYFQPETSVPPFVLIHLLWMQRALVHLFPRNFVERATDRSSRRAIYLSTDLPRAPNGRRENLWCTQDRCLRSDGRTWKSWD